MYVIHLDACNQQCLFCFKSEEIARSPLATRESALRQIIAARKAGYRSIDFFGGEPTVFPFLKEAVDIVQDLGMTAHLATNAVKFSSPAFARRFFQGLDREKIIVRTSFHSQIPMVHDFITQRRGSQRQTVAGIKNILAGTDKLAVNIVITALNYEHLPEMAEYIWGLGVRAIKFSGMLPKGEILRHKELIVGPETYGGYLLEALKRAEKSGFLLIEAEKISREFYRESGLEKNKHVKVFDFVGYEKS
jgi:MoaA/NifB/PqqE/SkfB family radical SAM enzyme